MESKIIQSKKNPFLNREELIIELNAQTTPTHAEVTQIIGKDAELTVVKKINTNFGTQNFVVEAVVYNSPEDKEKVEVIPKKIRKKMEAEKKAAEEAEKKAQEEAKKAQEEAKAAEAAAAQNTEEPEENTEEVKEGEKSE